jgi:hypothetical protein
MNKKTLVICGDSWFTTDSDYPDQSFSEILAIRHNLQLENLARSGCSNFGIALQINKAIELRPDFIIVGCTTHDRIDIPMIKDTNIIKKFFNWESWSQAEQSIGSYDRDRGLLNVKYSHATKESSSQYSNPEFESIISESINNLLWRKSRYGLNSDITESLKQYMLHLYDSNIKQQIDCWIMSEAARRLVESKIPFLLYIEPLFHHDFIDDISWLDPKYKVMHSDFSFNQYTIGRPIFHIDYEDSISFANNWEHRLRIEGFLDNG